MKKERGITLVALIITIIILIILSIVTIGTLRSGNLLDLAKGAADSYQVGEVEERFVIPQATVTAEAGQEGREPTMDEYIEELEKKDVIDPNETVENEDGSKEVVTPDGWVARVVPTEEDKSKVDHVEVEGKAEDLTVKIVKLQLTATTRSIKADITVKRGEGATYAYYYKEGAIGEAGEYKEAITGTENLSYTIDGLDQDKIYTIKVEATNKNGTSEKYAEARTKVIEYGEGELDFENTTWKNGIASVVIKKTSQDNYTVKYDVYDEKGSIVNGRKDITIENGQVIDNLQLGYTVKARLTDGYNYSGNTATVTIVDLDKPIEFTPVIKNIQPTSFTIDASSAKDNESGIAYYNYYIDGKLVLGKSTSATYNATNQKDGMTHKVYVEAVDKAENLRKSANADAVLPLANVAPVINSVSVASKTPTTLTIRVNATDPDAADQGKLTYKVYIDAEKTPKRTLENQAQGKNIDLEVTGLSNYTDYTYHVEVTDTVNHTATKRDNKAKTQCTGTTKYCSGGGSEWCSGGSSYTCPGGTTTTTQCSGGRVDHCPGPDHNNDGFYDKTCPHGYSSSHTIDSPCIHGNMSAHTVTTTSPCSHGNTSPHTVTETCEHGRTSAHSYGRYNCGHGYYNGHYYCAHNYGGVAHD